jgi:hypothetical protein
MRKSFIPQALAVGLLAPAVVGVAAAQPVHAAAGRQVNQAGPCHTARDTTGSCSVVNTTFTIKFPVCRNHYVSCRPVILHAATNSVYPLGLVVLVPNWSNSRDSIHSSDKVSLRVNKQGLIAFTVTTRRGTVRSHFAYVTFSAPRGGYKYLWVLTKTHGWQRVKGTTVGHSVVYRVTQPGVYKWTHR